jgi:hypothetical protein
VPSGATDVAVLATGLADRMMRMQANAETVLSQGFTSVRVPGAKDGLDVALKLPQPRCGIRVHGERRYAGQ